MPTEGLPSDSEMPADSKASINPSDIDSLLSDSKLPFPDASKKFYFHEGRRWGRNETRNKDRDNAPVDRIYLVPYM